MTLIVDNEPREKHAGGRPVKLHPDEDTLRTLAGLAKIQCTNVEAAAVLGVCRETFEQFLGKHKKAFDAWNNGKDSGRASLRRMQWKTAEQNPTMQIWLGKQYLDQKDKQEFGGDADNPIQTHNVIEYRVVRSQG